MTTGNLAFRNARQYMKSYSEESDVIQRHNEAMDCRNWEDVIHMAIDAFEWTLRADQSYRVSIYQGEEEDIAIEREIEGLFYRWMEVSARLEPHIQRQIEGGFKLDRLAEYRRCVTEIVAIVKSLREGDDQTLPDVLIQYRDAAIQEFHNGETTEFF